MKTKRKIQLSFSEEVPTLSISLPTGWEQLTQQQLSYYCLVAAETASKEELKVWCALYFSGLRGWCHFADGNCFIRTCGNVFQISVDDIADAVAALDWLDELPTAPVRLDCIGPALAVDAELHGVCFEDYLKIENLYQGLLNSHAHECLVSLCSLLYPGVEPLQIKPMHEYAVVLWLVGLKCRLADVFTELFRPAADPTLSAPPNMMEIMNAEIRALTGGDLTKEAAVLASDTWRALTELNAKAHDNRKFEERPRKHKK